MPTAQKEVKIEEALCTLHSSLWEIFPFNHHFFSCFRETVIKTNKMMIKSCCWWWWRWLQYCCPGTDKTGSRPATAPVQYTLISAHITYICEDAGFKNWRRPPSNYFGMHNTMSSDYTQEWKQWRWLLFIKLQHSSNY